MPLARTAAAAAFASCAFALPLPAAATIVTYQATLTGSAEAPANASPATGSAIVTYDDATSMLGVHFVFSGLLGTTTASHIHCCTTVAGTGTAAVATPVPRFPGFATGVNAGSYDGDFDLDLASSWNPAFVTAHGSLAAAKSDLLAGLSGGQAYLNIHTDLFPAGEIRGFLTLVPEPAGAALAVLALALAGLARRRHG